KTIDQAGKEPLSNVNLSITGSRIGTVSGKQGDFSFFIDSLPATLTVSHVGYRTKTILLDKTSFSLTIYLEPSIGELEEVEIKARGRVAFFKDDFYSVKDYEIDSGIIYLLIYRARLLNAEIICKNTAGDTLARLPVIRFSPNRLFRDCMGYVHVLSNDSGFQIYRRENILYLIHPVELKKFDDVLKNCVASTPETFYFQNIINKGLSVEYYGINRTTLIRRSLASVSDEKRLKMLRRNQEDLGLLWKTSPPNDRDEFVTWNYVHKILYRPIKTGLYRIGSYISIFDTPERQLEFYDLEGNYSYKIGIKTDTIHNGRWTNEILVDEATEKVYTTYLKNGRCIIYRIDINTGNLRRIFEIIHPFPQKLRIYDGNAYYLYDVPGSYDNKMIFKQGL
ncbi:MAG: carboxypeptidase-like regulatory domain-containing protein, partial [Bacteroidales bacterium]|nr:carboxypeptidase-like regulatory domain-containing protein [Bacteroidales bacterium]